MLTKDEIKFNEMFIIQAQNSLQKLANLPVCIKCHFDIYTKRSNMEASVGTPSANGNPSKNDYFY